MKSTACPKCGYARQPADDAPAWRCPSCGIAYDKYRPRAAVTDPLTTPDLRKQYAPAGMRDAAWGVATLVYSVPLVAGIFVAVEVGYAGIWRWLVPVITLSSFLYWLGAYRRKRMIEDVPTSSIAAAAQGYVELHGRAVAAPGETLRGPLTGVPCVWYLYDTHPPLTHDERDTGSRGVPFVLRDESGDCLVDPGEAEVVCDRCQEWEKFHNQGDFVQSSVQLREWSIRTGDPVYAIGYFSSGTAEAQRPMHIKVGYALAEQERDRDAFLARYDANRDGRVDRSELAATREALLRDAAQHYSRQGGLHKLGPSPDGRPFLILNLSPEKVASRYRRLTAIHLAVFMLSLLLLAMVWSR